MASVLLGSSLALAWICIRPRYLAHAATESWNIYSNIIRNNAETTAPYFNIGHTKRSIVSFLFAHLLSHTVLQN